MKHGIIIVYTFFVLFYIFSNNSISSKYFLPDVWRKFGQLVTVPAPQSLTMETNLSKNIWHKGEEGTLQNFHFYILHL